MKNKGFTLIELLAVIVILAIIALIAVPIVLNIIKDSKESATLRSAELYIDAVELAVAKSSMTTTFPSGDEICSVLPNGNLSCQNLSDPIEVEMSGEKPTGGQIKFHNGKMVNDSNTRLIMPDGNTYTYNNGKLEKSSGSLNNGVALSTITVNNYGDYIDLGQNVVGTNLTSDDWRILYNDTTNGVVYAILADYLPNSTGVAVSAGLNTNGAYDVYLESGSAEDFLSCLTTQSSWKSLLSADLQSNNNVYVHGAVTAEILIASYNQKHGTTLNYVNDPYLDETDSLYVPIPTFEVGEYGYSYFLANVNENDSQEVWDVATNGHVWHYYYWTPCMGVRPVVLIPSSLLVTSTTSNGITVWNLAN